MLGQVNNMQDFHTGHRILSPISDAVWTVLSSVIVQIKNNLSFSVNMSFMLTSHLSQIHKLI